MSDRVTKALENKQKGYNCAQAVICAYCDLFGIEEETAFRISEGLGGGMGGMHDGTCGAVSAMYLLAGLKGSSGCAECGVSKPQTYAQVRALADEFKAMNRSTICQDLLGMGDPLVNRSCDGCIEDAGHIIERQLIERSPA